MSDIFDLRGGEMAIGDPAVRLVHYKLGLPSGCYRLVRGALRHAMSSDSPLIDLDRPCVFVMDSALEREFAQWFEATDAACCRNVASVAKRLPELETRIGARVGLYWDDDLSERSREGQYVLDLEKVELINAAPPPLPSRLPSD